MKKSVVILSLVGVLFLATLVYSASDAIVLKKSKDCHKIYWNETKDVYGDIIRYTDTYGPCTHSNGTLGQCKNGTESYQSHEKIGSKVVTKSRRECVDARYKVNTSNKIQEIDFGDEWACINKEENSCLIVECVHKNDGAHNGKYTDCKGGKTCQRFEFCDKGLRTLFKNSRADFAEDDSTFYAKKLEVKEVRQ